MSYEYYTKNNGRRPSLHSLRKDSLPDIGDIVAGGHSDHQEQPTRRISYTKYNDRKGSNGSIGLDSLPEDGDPVAADSGNERLQEQRSRRISFTKYTGRKPSMHNTGLDALPEDGDPAAGGYPGTSHLQTYMKNNYRKPSVWSNGWDSESQNGDPVAAWQPGRRESWSFWKFFTRSNPSGKAQNDIQMTNPSPNQVKSPLKILEDYFKLNSIPRLSKVVMLLFLCVYLKTSMKPPTAYSSRKRSKTRDYDYSVG